MELLRELPGRRVWREGDVLVKAFRHPSPLMRWRDGRRARRELDVLARLTALGLPVPRPLGFERRAGAACARIAWVAGTRTLEQVLDEAADAAVAARSRTDLVEDAARLVARFSSAGLHQPDWHPKNLLVDGAGALVAIDFHKARLAEPTPASIESAARRMASVLFEQLDARELLAAAHAWYAALPDHLRPVHTARRALLRRLWIAARAERLEQVERDLDRWLRTSGAVEREGAAWVGRVRTFGARFELTCDARALAAAWIDQARLCEHRVPCARPERLELGGRPRALFVVPDGARAPRDLVLDPLELLAERLGPSANARALVERSRAGTTRWTAPDGTIHLVPRDARPADV
ncbi:3-deoxy-D-manno-octulosonic-acid kinase [Planctomycetes bacterium Pla163]|uniref:3-deoxy-D-manno-octulosonic-acid kinase n=1 Tax=Rohdeia mirabilis TaxID=2528008 RepID=A0A518D268_9BACT|nr:3-deoxy-D-manno-octulosonic-acid kinase [Planctomycetes bacterium Pla163]